MKKKEETINKLKKEIETTKKNIEKEYEKKNLEMKKNYELNKERIESKYREEINRISFQHTLELNELQIKLDSQISQLKIDNIKLKENYQKLLELTTNSSSNEKKNLLSDLSLEEKKENINVLENFKIVKKDFIEKMKRNSIIKDIGYKNIDSSSSKLEKKFIKNIEGKKDDKNNNTINAISVKSSIGILNRKNSKRFLQSSAPKNNKIRINVREKK